MLTETLSVPYGPERFSALTHDFRLRRAAAPTPGPTLTCNSSAHLEGGGASNRPQWAGLAWCLALGAGLQALMH